MPASASPSAFVNPMSLEGRTIIVTGAAQGIGQAIARLAFALGGNIALIDLNEDKLQAAAAEFSGERVITAAGSVADAAFIEEAVSSVVERFGAIHGLVNNAGIIRPAMIEKMTLDQWQQVLDVHLNGTFNCLQAVGRHMVERAKNGEASPGSIVNISSEAGLQGTIGQINYGVAKAGILGATMSAAREWARYGIRVNSVAFGIVETAMTEVARGDKFREIYLAKIPLGRWSTPEEAANPVCFLLSSAASYITGQHLPVNGGSYMSA